MTYKSREQWGEDLDEKIRKLGYEGKIPINLVHKKRLLEKERKKYQQLKWEKEQEEINRSDIDDIKLDNGKPRKKAPYWPMNSETKY
ncbi:MAG: hypothetical protein HOL90_01070 [Candidatus Nitrosopelagicus sp.]|jgi:hypothetical protein|nr:hypothetical protein [Candidatus Nitrosopelagicus sp.]